MKTEQPFLLRLLKIKLSFKEAPYVLHYMLALRVEEKIFLFMNVKIDLRQF